MWRYAAARYRDHPIAVGYDLMIEPNANVVIGDWLGDPTEIWSAEEFYSQHAGTLYDWNQLYPRVSDAIREVDLETPILIGGGSYSTVNWLPYLEPTGDPRTVYTVHQYAPHAYTHRSWEDPDFAEFTYPGFFDTDYNGVPEPFDHAWLEAALSPIDEYMETHGVPVAANECGTQRWVLNGAEFMRDQMEILEQFGVNYAVWEWKTSWEPMREHDAFNFRHGPDPRNHEDLETSDLMDALSSSWSRNAVRPSTFYEERFVPWGAASDRQPDLIQNASFESDTTAPWFAYGDAAISLDDSLASEGQSSAIVEVSSVGASASDSGIGYYTTTGFRARSLYTFSLFLKARAPREATIIPELAAAPWTSYGRRTVTLTTEWQEYRVEFQPDVDVHPASLTIHVGASTTDFWMDGLRWYEGSYTPGDGPKNPWDVNRDGRTDIVDLVTIARRFGMSWSNLPGDVNADGTINIVDLVTVASHFGETTTVVAGAPQLPRPNHSDAIARWLREAGRADDGSEDFRRGIDVLERLLAAITPGETRLLPNYPNPFNPETWIPFELDEAAEVTVIVYDALGQMVRRLELGRQDPGVYRTTSRAAYWNGRNEQGEPTSSGAYFAELTAGDFREARRIMLVK